MASVHNMCDLAVAHGRLASGWTPVLVMPFYVTKITTIIVMITDTFCMLRQSRTLLVCVYIYKIQLMTGLAHTHCSDLPFASWSMMTSCCMGKYQPYHKESTPASANIKDVHV